MNGGILIPNEDIVLMAEKEEPRFLNILLKDKDALQDALSYGIIPSENSQVGHFLNEKNNILYAIIRTNFLKYGTLLTRSAMDSIVDMMNIGTEEEKANIKSHWDQVWNRHDATPEDYQMLKEHINDRYTLLQFYGQWKRGDQIIKSISGHSDLIKKYISDLNAIKNLDPDSYSITMGIEDGTDEAMKFIDNKRVNPHDDSSIRCGIESIDNILHGFTKPSYTVVSGHIGGGKTTLMMNMGLNMALKGYNVAYASLEKDAKLFFRRTLACHALTDYNRIKTGGKEQWGLNDYWYGKLQDAAKDLKRIKPNYHCLQFIQSTKLTKILSEVDKLNSRKKIDVLIVDYLQVIGTETHTVGRYDVDLANIHKRLMGYGRKHNLVVFTALQLKSASSKDIRKKAEKVVSESQMSSISVNTEDYSGSQMIIADADNALGLVLNADKPATKMFVSFSKARDDESRRTICLDFDPKVGRVSDPEYGAGSVQAVEAMSKELFDNATPEEDMISEDNLFKEAEKQEKNKTTKEEVKNIKDSVDHVADVIDESNIEGDKDNSSSSDVSVDEFLAEEKPKEVVKEPPKEERKKGQDLAEKNIGEQSIDDVLGLI